MVDRESRDKLSEAITAFQNDAIGAFDFDDQICDICDNTKDKTIDEVALILWGFYDDCTDHKIVAIKAEWDLFERLRLLLESDAELEIIKIPRKQGWSIRQLMAAVSLAVYIAAFIYMACVTGFGLHLFSVSIPFGLVSFAICYRWLRQPSRGVDAQLDPFPSYSALNRVRRQIHWFKKRRYPNRIAGRKIRSRSHEIVPWLPVIVICLLFVPFALICMSLPPRTEHDMQLLMPSAAVTS